MSCSGVVRHGMFRLRIIDGVLMGCVLCPTATWYVMVKISNLVNFAKASTFFEELQV